MIREALAQGHLATSKSQDSSPQIESQNTTLFPKVFAIVTSECICPEHILIISQPTRIKETVGGTKTSQKGEDSLEQARVRWLSQAKQSSDRFCNCRALFVTWGYRINSFNIFLWSEGSWLFFYSGQSQISLKQWIMGWKNHSFFLLTSYHSFHLKMSAHQLFRDELSFSLLKESVLHFKPDYFIIRLMFMKYSHFSHRVCVGTGLMVME